MLYAAQREWLTLNRRGSLDRRPDEITVWFAVMQGRAWLVGPVGTGYSVARDDYSHLIMDYDLSGMRDYDRRILRRVLRSTVSHATTRLERTRGAGGLITF